MNRNDRDPLERAKQEVAESRIQLDEVLNRLEGRIDTSINRVTRIFRRLQVPERMARKLPFGNATTFLLLGFAIGSLIGERREAKRVTAQPPPFPAAERPTVKRVA